MRESVRRGAEIEGVGEGKQTKTTPSRSAASEVGMATNQPIMET